MFSLGLCNLHVSYYIRFPTHYTTTVKMVKAGDPIPEIELMEGPETKVNIGKELSSGKGLIIGVPAAYSA